MKLLVISGIESHANNCKVYCTYISLESGNIKLGNSSAILYSFLVLVNVFTISMHIMLSALHLPLKISLYRRFTGIKFYAIMYSHIHFIIKLKVKFYKYRLTEMNKAALLV